MPERPDEFEEAWARIVADLTSEDAAATPAPAPDPPAGPSVPGSPAAGETGETPATGLHQLFEPLRRAEAASGPSPEADPGAFVDNWEDEGHYTPPPPPELPVGTPAKRLAWAGLLGGPAALAGITLTGWQAPQVVLVGAGLATLAGFVTLVWHLPASREDGWDDGARL